MRWEGEGAINRWVWGWFFAVAATRGQCGVVLVHACGVLLVAALAFAWRGLGVCFPYFVGVIVN